jgi:hypothetical protein
VRRNRGPRGCTTRCRSIQLTLIVSPCVGVSLEIKWLVSPPPCLIRNNNGESYEQNVFRVCPPLGRHRGLVWLAIVVIAGCDQSSPVSPSEAADLSVPLNEIVADSVQLSPGNLFLSNVPLETSRPVISRERATTLATGFIQTYARYVLDNLESQHGASIDLGALQPSGRVLLLEAASDPISDDVLNPVHKNAGPYYLVTFEQAGIPTVEISVSAYATDIELQQDGSLVYTGSEAVSGNEFRWAGTHTSPLATRRPVISPEKAAQIVASASGAVITQQPRFYRRGAEFAPYIGYWHLRLDRDVQVRTSAGGLPRFVRDIYVDQTGGEVGVPSTDVRPEFRPVSIGANRGGARTIRLNRRPQAPHGIVLVDFVAGGTQ